MSALFAWDNAALRGSVEAGSEETGLDAGQLQNEHGSPSTAWQTANGVLSSWVLVDAGDDAAMWDAFGLFRTNLTGGATVRWRVGAADMLGEAVALPWDTNGGALLAPNTTRVGTTADPDGGEAAVIYSSSATAQSFVRAAVTAVPANARYRIAISARRISGGGNTGAILVVDYPGPGGVVRERVPMSAVGPDWGEHALTVTTAAAGNLSVWFFANTGPVGEVAIWGGERAAQPTYDSGEIPADVAAGYGQTVHLAPVSVAGRVCRLDVSDPANPDGHLNVPLLFAGPAWRTAQGIGFDSADDLTFATPTIETRGGQRFPQPRWHARAWDIALPAVMPAEALDRVAELRRVATQGHNVLFAPFAGGPDTNREAVFGQLAPTATLGWPRPAPGRRRWAARIVERL